jgi:sulfate transport system ATP-binding protein
LLDEPFGALDARVRQELRQWLVGLHRELGVTSLLVTHDQEEALEVATRVVVMNEGRVEQVGTPQQIYRDPATPFVAGFVGTANVLHGRVAGDHVVVGHHRVPGAEHLEDGVPARAFVRPHDVVLAPGEGNGPVGGAARATVERVSDLGWLSRVTLRLSDGQVLVAEVPADRAAPVAEGSEVVVDLRRARAFPAAEPSGPSPAPTD